MKTNDPKVPKQVEVKKDGEISINFKQGKSYALQMLRIDRRRTWLHMPSAILRSTSSDTRQVVEIQKETSAKTY